MCGKQMCGMNVFRRKTREEKFVDYLISDGIFCRVPQTDEHFYRLAGECAGRTWPVEPGGRPLDVEQVETRTMSQSGDGSSNTHAVLKQTMQGGLEPENAKSKSYPESENNPVENTGMVGEQDSTSNKRRTSPSENPIQITETHKNICWSTPQMIFVPRPVLPYPLLQETYRKWKSGLDLGLRFRRLRKLRASLAFQPLDAFPAFLMDFRFMQGDRDSVGFFELLRDFLSVFFFGANVELRPVTTTETWGVTSRVSDITGQTQLLVTHLNDQLAKRCLLPQDFAIVGITWSDLYPCPKKNFVLGQATGETHSASVSFGRFETNPREPRTELGFPDIDHLDGELMWKMLKVVAHESCHLFYMAHCVFFECLMNDSRSVDEAMSQPLYLCPVCMRKLQKVLRFTTVTEYLQNLVGLYQVLVAGGLGCQPLEETIRWIERCVLEINVH